MKNNHQWIYFILITIGSLHYALACETTQHYSGNNSYNYSYYKNSYCSNNHNYNKYSPPSYDYNPNSSRCHNACSKPSKHFYKPPCYRPPHKKHSHRKPPRDCPCNTPEPVSSILFLLGGCTLAVRFCKKNKIDSSTI